jgi:2-C-methyl-D-erythritol 2,4-cyclodiphosphate synthase
MSTVRVGLGFDVHRFSDDPGRALVLGGVVFDGVRGLEGHSDADAIAHAVTDALLGAAGLGDIGAHFPDTDPKYSDIDSRRLLRDVAKKVAALGFRIVNVDATIIAQAPRMAPHVARMIGNIAADLGIAPASVGGEATTTERLGLIGRGEGIAAQAVALID